MDISYQTMYTLNPQEARRRVVQTYQEVGSIAQTARAWHTSRQVVRKWVRRYESEEEDGLQDQSRRPHTSPRQTSPLLEDQVVQLRQATRYGRKRLSRTLWLKCRIPLSPHTIRHILRRHGLIRKRHRRKTCYPAHWAWNTQKPFTLAQVDAKYIHDEGTLGPRLIHHLHHAHLPRYQWTFLEGLSRLRFLAFSHELTSTNALCFAGLVLFWLRAHGLSQTLQWQTDWGSEWGGDSLAQIERLNHKLFEPLGAQLVRFPLGRKGYNGRVERSHRTDDEEFYLPLLETIPNEQAFLRRAAQWVYYYNLERPHSGEGMDGLTPWAKLRELGVKTPKTFALLPPVVLDPISLDWVLHPGNDLLTHYRPVFTAPRSASG
jgi:transposase-like protein